MRWSELERELRELQEPPMPPQAEIDAAISAAGEIFQSGSRLSEQLPPAGWTEFWLDLAPTVGAALLLLALWFGFAPSHDGEKVFRKGVMARSKKLVRELSVLFPGRLEAVVAHQNDFNLAISDQAAPQGRQPVLLEISRRGERSRIVTFSGETVELPMAGELLPLEVLLSGTGEILILGPDFLWSNLTPSKPRGFHISAAIMEEYPTG